MEGRITVGEMRDILAGLRDDVIQGLAIPDETMARWSTAEGEAEGVRFYYLALEVEG